MDIGFKGLTVFITGGSKGIGADIKQFLTKNGAKVIAPSRSEMDLSDRESIHNYIATMNTDVDIIIHCAGLNIKSELTNLQMSDVDSVFQVNYDSIVQILKELTPGMKKKGHGKIALISSLYSMISREGRIAYSSSKNALTGLCKTLALELSPFGIMINCVAPGYVMTEMTEKNLSKEEIHEIEKMIPTGRFQEKEEISSLVAFLCSDYNRSITGQLIAVDGGFLCR